MTEGGEVSQGTGEGHEGGPPTVMEGRGRFGLVCWQSPRLMRIDRLIIDSPEARDVKRCFPEKRGGEEKKKQDIKNAVVHFHVAFQSPPHPTHLAIITCEKWQVLNAALLSLDGPADFFFSSSSSTSVLPLHDIRAPTATPVRRRRR